MPNHENPYTKIVNQIEELRKMTFTEDQIIRILEIRKTNINKLDKETQELDKKYTKFNDCQKELLNLLADTTKDSAHHYSYVFMDDKLHPDFIKVMNFIKEYKDNYTDFEKFPYPGLNQHAIPTLAALGDNLRDMRRQLVTHAYDKLTGIAFAHTMDSMTDLDEKLMDMEVIEPIQRTENMLSMMAVSATYNDMIYDKVKNLIHTMSTDENWLENRKKDLDHLGIEVKGDDKEAEALNIRGSLYQLYFTSARFKEYQISYNSDFKSKVKGNELPEVFKAMKADLDAGKCSGNQGGDHYGQHMKAIRNYIKDMETVSRKNHLSDVDPATFARGIAQYEKEHDLMPGARNAQVQADAQITNFEALTHNNDLLAGIDSAFFKELAHNKGNFRTSNSKSYNAMGDALANIRKKQGNMEAVDNKDYEALFDRCVEYMMQHDSIPSSKSGKKRFQAASAIAGALAAKLRKSPLDDTAETTPYLRAAMLRSKDFRDAYVSTAQKEIFSNCTEDGRINRDKLEEAWDLSNSIDFCTSVNKHLQDQHQVMVTEKTIANDKDVTREQIKHAVKELSNQVNEIASLQNKAINRMGKGLVNPEMMRGVREFNINQYIKDNKNNPTAFPVPMEKVAAR